MDSLIVWILEHTKLGKLLDLLEGKKQMLASLGTAFVATGTIIVNYTKLGTPYLLHVGGTPEFVAASAGWIGFFNALKGEKIRDEIAAIKQPPATPAEGAQP